MPDETPQADNRWLAYELHDGLLQWVISSRMQVESVMAILQPNEVGRLVDVDESASAEVALKKLAVVHRSLGAAIEEGRQLIGFIEQSAAAGRWDLPSALASLSEELLAESEAHEQTLCIRGFEELAWMHLPLHVGWNLMRIIQQALRNAIRHAGPCKISAEGWCSDDGRHHICVSDNGRGFDVSLPVATNHFGLSSLEHRAKLMGAELEIASSKGQGTEIHLSFAT